MITFQEAIAENMKFAVAPGCKTEVIGYFTNFRVDRSTIPEGWNAYDIRHGDSGNFCSLEEHVVVNHAGTFLTQGTVKLLQHGLNKSCYSLKGRAGYTFL